MYFASSSKVQVMNVPFSTRVRLGIGLIALVAVASTLRQLQSTSSFHSLRQTDDVSQYEQRFTEVRHSLPFDQIVAYRDEFAPFSRQCNAFVLAQYSVAPTVLAVLDSQCGHMNDTGEVSSRRSGLLLENFHDFRNEPYLLRLFPTTYFQPDQNSAPVVKAQGARAAQMVLLNDFGLGVRLYARGDK